jgi:aryl-alcohol dehydrogenase-like predicted oxidoreductase
MADIAKATGRSMAQAATNWVRQSRQGQVIPIIAARTERQLADNLTSLDWQLTSEQLERLEAASHIDLGFPHDFLEGNRNIFGATFDLIDHPARR